MPEGKHERWRPSPEQRADLRRKLTTDPKFAQQLRHDGFTVEEYAEALERAFCDESWPGGTPEEYYGHLGRGIARELQKIKAARGRMN